MSRRKGRLSKGKSKEQTQALLIANPRGCNHETN